MGALILRVSARHGRGVEFHRITPEGITVGRGLGNTLILPDPYLGAEQFRLAPAEDALWLELRDRTNPLRVNGVARAEERLALRPGDRIETGRSVFTVLDAGAAVPPALSLDASPWERLGFWRAPIALALVVLAAVLVAGLDYLRSTGAPQWDELALSGFTVAGLSMGWAAFWSALAAMLRQHADFWAHLALAAAAGIVWFGGAEAGAYVAYAFAADAAAFISTVSWWLGGVLMILLLWGALELATPLRNVFLAACAATFAAQTLMALQDVAERDDFVAQPQPVTVLRAPFAKLRPGLDYEAFDAGVGALFAGLPEEDRAARESRWMESARRSSSESGNTGIGGRGVMK
jgi:hypothetical protein